MGQIKVEYDINKMKINREKKKEDDAIVTLSLSLTRSIYVKIQYI